MPRLKVQVTDTYIKSLKPQNKVFLINDSDKLFIQIKPTGKKYFIIEYKSPLTKKIRRMTLGEYPFLTLAKARALRNEHLRAIQEGLDPLEKRHEKIKTFSEVFHEWFKVKSKEITPKQIKVINSYFQRFYITNFGQKNIKDVTKKKF